MVSIVLLARRNLRKGLYVGLSLVANALYSTAAYSAWAWQGLVGTPDPNPTTACNNILDALGTPAEVRGNYTPDPDVSGPPTGPAQFANCRFHTPDGTPSAPNWTGMSSVGIADPTCNLQLANSGQPFTMDGIGASPPPAYCNTVAHCRVNRVGPTLSMGGSWISTFQAVQEDCNTNDTKPGNDTNSNCLAKGGVSACVSKTDNTGTVNGDKVDPAAVPPGRCVVYASGGASCVVAMGATPTTPPAPNNGTAGTPATPTASISNATSTANYYSSSTVNNSTTVTSGTQGATSSSGTGSTGSTGSGSEANGDCSATNSCDETGDAALPSLENEETYAGIGAQFFADAQNTPIGQSLGSLHAQLPAAACPTGSFTFQAHTYAMDWHCSLFQTNVAPIITAIFAVGWILVGVRILMSA